MVDYHQKRHRFQITIKSVAGTVSHVCSAYTETEAIERVKRAYGAADTQLVRIMHLGCKASTTLSGSDNHFGRFFEPL